MEPFIVIKVGDDEGFVDEEAVLRCLGHWWILIIVPMREAAILYWAKRQRDLTLAVPAAVELAAGDSTVVTGGLEQDVWGDYC